MGKARDQTRLPGMTEFDTHFVGASALGVSLANAKVGKAIFTMAYFVLLVVDEIKL